MWRSCHSWRYLGQRRLTAMTLIAFLILFVLIAVLAPRYGVDSRGLRDHPWERRH